MATMKDIITLPNEHLRQRSTRIGLVTPEILEVVESMKQATLDWEKNRKHELGVALAAIQIDQPYRLVIVRNDFDNKEDETFQVLINPEITKLEGEVVEDFEGCLSVKDLYGKVPRHTKVRVKALDENGCEIRLKAEGFLARVLQHEIDHTNGTVFIDHIKDRPEAFYKITDSGQLEPLDYVKVIKNNSKLWQ